MMPRWGYAVDLDRCMGCKACLMACKIENNTPEGSLWMEVFRYETGDYPDGRLQFLPRPCMHCENAPCAKVCPVGARYRRDDGIVLTDFERCIGCRYCMVACPYSVNNFNWQHPEENQYHDWNGTPEIYGAGRVSDSTGGAIPPYRNPDLDKKQKDGRLTAGGGHFTGVVEKCTFCVHRVDKGLKPACVANCPVEALVFGDLDDHESDVSKLLARKVPFQLLPEVGTEPRVFYVGGHPPPPGVVGTPPRFR